MSLNSSIRYVSHVVKKKYQPSTLKNADFVNGKIWNYLDYMNVYFKINGKEFVPAFERNEEQHLVLFEYALQITEGDNSYNIPVHLVYDPKAKFNTLGCSIESNGETVEQLIYNCLLQAIKFGISESSEIDKINSSKHKEKLEIEMDLGDIITTTKETLVAALPLSFKVKEKA